MHMYNFVPFLRLSNILSYICHIFFNLSSVSIYLVYFHVLAIVNSAAMNNGMHVSFGIMVFLRDMYRSKIYMESRKKCTNGLTCKAEIET